MDFWGILEYTMAVTIIGLLIWLVKLIFHDKLDARWHYLIWLVLLVRMLVPVRFGLISASISVFHEIPLVKWIEIGKLLAEKRGYGEVISGLGRVWLWGAALLGGFYLAMWAALRIQVGKAPKADTDVKDYVDGIAGKYGLKSCSDIRILKSSTPYICGVVRPVLVLPEREGGTAQGRRTEGINAPDGRGEPGDFGIPEGGELPEESVIVHELLHRQFGDVLVNLGIHLVRVINWFNPFIWMLTSVVQNDSEALCDQRVLEYCGEENVQNYGETLISMSEGKRRNSVKIGTSNMASSYRNIKTRIRRIRDFRRVPQGIGLATLCITLMLALAGIGSSAREEGYEVAAIASEQDLELALLQARCYHARTPEEAVYLFLRSYKEGNTVYRMSVMPEKEIPQYEAFALEWFERQDIRLWAELFDGENGYPAYFPKEASAAESFRVYNLLYDEQEGSATVCARFRGQNGPAFAEWKLALMKEEGWKVWLENESVITEGEYEPEALVSCSVRMGDFLVEMYGYNEGYFNELETFWSGAGLRLYQSDGQKKEVSFPDCFSQEYKYQSGNITYLGEENLEGYMVRVLVTETKEEESEWFLDQTEGMVAQGYGNPGTLSAGITYSGENSSVTFSGRELMTGEPRLVCGKGSGRSCWKKGDRIEAYIRIYVGGILREEGEVWSETL